MHPQTAPHNPVYVWASLLLALLTLLACTDATPGGPATGAGDVDFYAQAVAAEQQRQQAEATLANLYAQQTATAQAAQVTATQRAWEATTTVEAGRVTATAQAWQTTVEAAYVQATATAAAEAIQATATTQAAQTTATVAAIQFQQQATATAAAWAVAATATVEAAQGQATLQAAAVARAEQAVRRAEVSSLVLTYVPLAALVAFLLLLLWVGYRWARAWELRLRAVPRDARGDAPVLILDQRGACVVLDPDRAFGPATVVGATVIQPVLTAPDYQAQVTARDQTVDLAHRGLPTAGKSVARRPTPAQAVQVFGAPPPTGPVRVLPAAQIQPWLRDVRAQVFRDALTVNDSGGADGNVDLEG